MPPKRKGSRTPKGSQGSEVLLESNDTSRYPSQNDTPSPAIADITQEQQQQRRSPSKTLSLSPSPKKSPLLSSSPAAGDPPRRSSSKKQNSKGQSSGSELRKVSSPPPSSSQKSGSRKRERSQSGPLNDSDNNNHHNGGIVVEEGLPEEEGVVREEKDSKPSNSKYDSSNSSSPNNNNNNNSGARKRKETPKKKQNSASSLSSSVENTVLRVKNIAPDISGIRCMDYMPYPLHAKDITGGDGGGELCIAREDGSLLLYQLLFFQNIPHFTLKRHTGGAAGRTITSVHYIRTSSVLHTSELQPFQREVNNSNDDDNDKDNGYPLPSTLLLLSYLSGQVVLCNGETLFPLFIYERSGGAIWDMKVMEGDHHPSFSLDSAKARSSNPKTKSKMKQGGDGTATEEEEEDRDRYALLFTANADGSWHQLRLHLEAKHKSAAGTKVRNTALFSDFYKVECVLEKIIPSDSGADRALSISVATVPRQVTSQTKLAPTMYLAVGTNDAGHVVAWQMTTSEADTRTPGASRQTGFSSSLVHDMLFMTRLPQGFGLCSAIDVAPLSSSSPSSSSSRPAIAVGTSTGDVVLFDYQLHTAQSSASASGSNGVIFATFSLQKGPVQTMVYDWLQRAFYFSGYHDSLRAVRYGVSEETPSQRSFTTPGHPLKAPHGRDQRSEEVGWFPAEVKRRCHYHETSQLLLLSSRQRSTTPSVHGNRERDLILSASRDGTVLFQTLSKVFTAPGMYLHCTTQNFQYCPQKNILLFSRQERIESFRLTFPTDAVPNGATTTSAGGDTKSGKYQLTPFFAYKISGNFLPKNFFIDSNHLNYIVFSTSERVVLARLHWREHIAKGTPQPQQGDTVVRIHHIEEVLPDLPAGEGLIDVCFVDHKDTNPPQDDAVEDVDVEAKLTRREKRLKKIEAGRQERHNFNHGNVYLLFDHSVLMISLQKGYLTLTHPLPRNKHLRPEKLWYSMEDHHLIVTDMLGAHSLSIPLHEDGSFASSPVLFPSALQSVQQLHPVPSLSPSGSDAWVGLSGREQRYCCWTSSSPSPSSLWLPQSLPHDVRFIAQLPSSSSSSPTFFGFFSKGLLTATTERGRKEWRMISRMNVETALVLPCNNNNNNNKEGEETLDGGKVLVIERNLERELESLPLMWKVRRFGN